jgi:hypothetical protein
VGGKWTFAAVYTEVFEEIEAEPGLAGGSLPPHIHGIGTE